MSLVSYRSHSTGTKIAPARICKTNRIIDDLVKPETFAQKPKLIALMDPSEPDSFNEIKYFFETFESEPLSEGKRIKILLPEVEVPYFPGNPRGHVVVRDTITEAWKEVLYLLTRFGHRVSLKKGDRLELQHVKVVVEKPEFEADKKLHEVNLDSQKLRRYQADILRGELRPDETYNYGHRCAPTSAWIPWQPAPTA